LRIARFAIDRVSAGVWDHLHGWPAKWLQCTILDFIPSSSYGGTMDWALAIERNRLPLLRIVAVLFGMIGLGPAAHADRIARPLHRAVLALLRPAEAAVRRLIVVAARGMVVKPRAHHPARAGRIISSRKAQGRVSFQLFDPRRVLTSGHGRRDAAPLCEPRIRFIDVTFDPRIPLFRPVQRVEADEPYARWRARPPEARRPRRPDSLRSGPPPGLRRKPGREVDEILAECHWLARHAAASDTS